MGLAMAFDARSDIFENPRTNRFAFEVTGIIHGYTLGPGVNSIDALYAAKYSLSALNVPLVRLLSIFLRNGLRRRGANGQHALKRDFGCQFHFFHGKAGGDIREVHLGDNRLVDAVVVGDTGSQYF